MERKHSDRLIPSSLLAGIDHFRDVPGWLRAPLQQDGLLEALRSEVPEFRRDQSTLQAVKAKRLFLKDAGGVWEGSFALKVTGAKGRAEVSFIDFDDYCLAEPALDVGLYRAAILDTGMNALDPSLEPGSPTRLERLATLDALCASFLNAYHASAQVSTQRVHLWETLDALRFLSRHKKALSGGLPVAVFAGGPLAKTASQKTGKRCVRAWRRSWPTSPGFPLRQ